tara:strand:+ start:210 stop:764 length:555 start_codon:yes stop_codon:yes gene_type:complete
MDSNSEMDSSIVYSERRNLQTLKRRQDEVFENENNECINLESIINEIIVNLRENRKLKCCLSRNILDIRKNYLKIRMLSTNLDRYINSGGDDESVKDVLRCSDFKIDVEIMINYGKEYPFQPPTWKIEAYHVLNLDSGVVLKEHLDNMIIKHKEVYLRDWTPAMCIKDDIKNYLLLVKDKLSNI